MFTDEYVCSFQFITMFEQIKFAFSIKEANGDCTAGDCFCLWIYFDFAEMQLADLLLIHRALCCYSVKLPFPAHEHMILA